MGTFGLGGLHRKSTWLFPIATFADLPPAAVDGSVVLIRDTNFVYQYDAALPGWIPFAFGGGGGGAISLGHRGIIPASATYQALDVINTITTTTTGFMPTNASTLVGISVTVDFSHPTNNYTVEVIQDPTGQQGTGPVVLGAGTLLLSAGSRTAYRRDLLVPMPAGAEIGAFFRRTTGAGASAPITSIIVILEYTTP